jgi:diphthamide biosynthesis methyltransferase
MSTLVEIASTIQTKSQEAAKQLTETTTRIDECNDLALAAIKAGDTLTATTLLKRVNLLIKPK